jgi:hypothetical protein
LDNGKPVEIDFAIYALQEDPGWGNWRFLAPADSQFRGYMFDLSIDGLRHRVQNRLTRARRLSSDSWATCGWGGA